MPDKRKEKRQKKGARGADPWKRKDGSLRPMRRGSTRKREITAGPGFNKGGKKGGSNEKKREIGERRSGGSKGEGNDVLRPGKTRPKKGLLLSKDIGGGLARRVKEKKKLAGRGKTGGLASR